MHTFRHRAINPRVKMHMFRHRAINPRVKMHTLSLFAVLPLLLLSLHCCWKAIFVIIYCVGGLLAKKTR